MKKYSFLLSILIIIFSFLTLSACVESLLVERNISAIEISEKAEFKTDYLVGEDLDLNGIVIKIISKQDSEKFSTYNLMDNLGMFQVYNFDSSAEATGLPVVIRYKTFQTFFMVNVYTDDSVERKIDVTLNFGASFVDDKQIEPVNFGASLEANELMQHVPEREGYVFDGWYLDEALLNEYDFRVEKVYSDLTIYVKWSKVHTVRFLISPEQDVYNQFAEKPVVINEVTYRIVDERRVKNNDNIELPPRVPQIEGKAGSWSTDLFERIDSPFDVFARYEDRLLEVSFKYWLPASNAYVEKGRIKNVPYGSNLLDPTLNGEDGLNYLETISTYTSELPNDIPSRVFSNDVLETAWDTEQLGTSIDNIRVDTVFIANWRIRDISIKFYVNENDEMEDERQTIPYRNKIRLPSVPEREGYDFDGWFKEPECINQWYFNNDLVESLGNQVISEVVLYAKWTRLYKISFYKDPAGLIPYEIYGSSNFTMQRRGAEFTLPAPPKKKGYDVKWDPNIPSIIVSVDRDFKTSETVHSYDVSYYDAEGNSIKTERVSYSENATRPAIPIKYGYKFEAYNFLGYSYGPNGEDPDQFVQENLDLHPLFSPHEINVFFYENENTSIPLVEIAYFDKSVSEVAPTGLVRESYVFKGWSIEPPSQPNRPLYGLYGRINSLHNITLYGVWNPKYTVNFYRFNAVQQLHSSIEVESGVIFSSMNVPLVNTVAEEGELFPTYRVGYDFFWLDDGVDVSTISNQPIIKDYNFVIVPQLKKYEITFILDGSLMMENNFVKKLIVSHGDTLNVVRSTFPDYATIVNNIDTDKYIFTNLSKWRIDRRDYDYNELFDIEIQKDTAIEPRLTIRQFEVVWKQNPTDQTFLYSDWVPYGSKAIYRGETDILEVEGEELDYWGVVYQEGGIYKTYNEGESGFLTNEVKGALTLVPKYKKKEFTVSFLNSSTGVSLSSEIYSYGFPVQIDVIINNYEEDLVSVGKVYTGWQVSMLQKVNRVYRHTHTENNVTNKYWQLNHTNISGKSVTEINSPLIMYKNKFYIIHVDYIDSLVVYINHPEDYIDQSDGSGLVEVVREANHWEIGQQEYYTAFLRFAGAVDKSFYFIPQGVARFSTVFEDTIFEIDFDLSGVDAEQNYPSLNIKYEGRLTEPVKPVPRSDNKIFLGWYTDAFYQNRLSVFPHAVYSNMTLYARWDDLITTGTNGIVYEIDSSGLFAKVASVELTITLPEDGSGIITINNYFENLPVEEIKAHAFASLPSNIKNEVKSFELPNTILRIDQKAFANLRGLKYIEIPSLVEFIGASAFDGCTALEAVKFADNAELKFISDAAFYNNIKLKYANADKTKLFKLPDKLISIGDYAFYNNHSIHGISFPATVMQIGESAFAHNENMRYIFMEGLAAPYLKNDVFWSPAPHIDALKIYVKTEALEIFKNAWQNNSEWLKYKEKIISSSLVYFEEGTPLWSFSTSIDEQNREYISLIQYMGVEFSDVLVPKDFANIAVRTIENYAFGASIKKISIGLDIEAEQYAFSAAINLESIKLLEATGLNRLSATSLTEAYSLPNARRIEIDTETKLNEVFESGNLIPARIREVIIYSSGSAIRASLFQDVNFVEKITFYTTATTIYEYAFSNMQNLRAIYIIEEKDHFDNYSKIARIEKEAFKNSPNLAYFKYLEGGSNTWEDGLIPHSFNIGEDILEGTAWLRNYQMSNPDKEIVEIGDNILYKYVGSQTNEAHKYVIPKTVKQIAPKAFMGVTSLDIIIAEDIFESQLERIGSSAFANMPFLETVVIPRHKDESKNVILGDKAFENSRRLSVLVWAPINPLLNTIDSYFGSNYLPTDDEKTGNEKSGLQLYFDTNYYASWALSSLRRDAKSRPFTSLEYLMVNENEGHGWLYGTVLKIDGVVEEQFDYESTLIKYVNSEAICKVPSVDNQNNAFKHYGGYVLSRRITDITLRANIKALKNSFNGLFDVTELTITGGSSASGYSLVGNKIYNLIENNYSLNALSLNGEYSIKTILDNESLNQRVKTVKILPGTSRITDEFLLNCNYVENIIILSEKDNVSYETSLSEVINDPSARGIVIGEIGARAFIGTNWYNQNPDDFIIVLDNLLIGYKGHQGVLDLNNLNINKISASTFEENKQLEAVYLPSNIEKIEQNAFKNASNLSKVFVIDKGAGAIPTLVQGAFNGIGIGYKIYVDENILNDFQTDSIWNDLDLQLMPYEVVETGRRWMSKSDGHYYLNVYMSKYLLVIDNANNATLEWQRELLNKYFIVPDTFMDLQQYNLDELELVEVQELNTALVPRSVSDNQGEYTITKIGYNAFLSFVNEIGFRLDVELSADGAYDRSFANIESFDILHLVTKNINLENREVSNERLKKLIDDKSVNTIKYFGNYMLDDLIEYNGRSLSIKNIVIEDGAVSTVDRMLAGWNDITSFEISESVKQLGVLSLEDTEWYKESEILVMARDILYKYKGNKTDPIINLPDSVRIINTGAFAKPKPYTAGPDWTNILGWDKSDFTFNTLSFAANSTAHTILDFAFANCVNLNVLNIPTTMLRIANNAFDGTYVIKQDKFWYAVDDMQRLTLLKYVGSNTVEVTIDTRVRVIASGAFKNAVGGINRITIPSGSNLEVIGDEAFAGSNLMYFDYNQNDLGLKKIGKDAFKGTDAAPATGYFVVKDGIIVYEASGLGKYNIDRMEIWVGEVPVYKDIISITKDAIQGYHTISLQTDILRISQDEMYNVLSSSSVRTFESYGNFSMEDLIGTKVPLDNIHTLRLLDGAETVAENFANGWGNITSIEMEDASKLKSVGKGAFIGTQFLMGEEIVAIFSSQGVVTLGESGIVISYSGGKNVHLGEDIKSITSDAFRENHIIEKIDMSDSQIRVIPKNAFENSSQLSEINLPSYVESVGEKAFDGTLWLANWESDLIVIDGKLVAYKGGKNVLIDSSVEKIYSYVFRNNSVIESVTFSADNRISYIEALTFDGCLALETVVLNDTIERIDPTAFRGTIFLSRNRTIYYIENAKSDREYKKLILSTVSGHITLDNSVTHISPYAYNDYNQITGITINGSSKIIEIPANLFANCNKLTAVNIYKSNLIFGENVFNANMPFFNTAQPNNEGFVILGSNYLFRYKGEASSIEIPSGVKYISEHAFISANNVEEVDFSKSLVKHIPSKLFYGKTSLESVILAGSYVDTIGVDAFKGSGFAVSDVLIGNLITATEAHLNLAETVRKIPASFFAGSVEIKTLTLNAPIEILDGAFENSSITEIINAEYITYIGESAFLGTPLYENSKDINGLVIVGNIIVGYEGDAAEITIPKTVKRISKSAFKDNRDITSLDFESGYLEFLHIEERAFENCINLENVNFVHVASKIEYLARNAFKNTKYLKNLDANNIGEVIVNDVLILIVKEEGVLSIPKTVRKIVGGIMLNSHNIAILNITPSLAPLEDYSIVIGTEAFKGAINLRTIEIGINVKEVIEKDAFSFTYWESKKGSLVLTNKGHLISYNPSVYEDSVNFSLSLQKVYPYVFRDNKAINEVDMTGANILALNENIFEGCINIDNIIWPEKIEKLSKYVAIDTKWYDDLPVGAYVLSNKLYFVKGDYSQVGLVLDDANIWEIMEDALEGVSELTLGGNISTGQSDIHIAIDDSVLDALAKIYVPTNKLNYYLDRFSNYSAKFEGFN